MLSWSFTVSLSEYMIIRYETFRWNKDQPSNIMRFYFWYHWQNSLIRKIAGVWNLQFIGAASRLIYASSKSHTFHYLSVGKALIRKATKRSQLPQCNAQAPHVRFCREHTIREGLGCHPANRKHGCKLKGLCHTICHRFKKLKCVFASIEFQK